MYHEDTSYSTVYHEDTSYPTKYHEDTSRTRTIVIVTSVLVTLIIIIIGCCIYRYKHKKRFNQQLISSRRNHNFQTHVFPLASVHRNTTRANEIHIPYTIPLSNTFEEEPPSYESAVSHFRTRY